MEPKSAPRPRAQYGQAPRRSCMGWILEGGPSSQWLRDGDFLWRGMQQSSVWIPEAAVGSPLLYFSFEYFWMRGGGFFAVWGGFKNKHDGDHYLETHSLSTSNSNNTHREWLRSLFGISRRARDRDNGVSLEMRWTVDTITIRSVNQWLWWRHNYRFTCSHSDSD